MARGHVDVNALSPCAKTDLTDFTDTSRAGCALRKFSASRISTPVNQPRARKAHGSLRRASIVPTQTSVYTSAVWFIAVKIVGYFRGRTRGAAAAVGGFLSESRIY